MEQTTRNVEADLIVDSASPQIVELCRRLLRNAQHAQSKAEIFHLILERFRQNTNDSADEINGLLMLMANHLVPTVAFTEEYLSLLFSCEHRVLLINHLAHLTYQSRECIEMVVEAYLDLLSSDRLLLAPILGSLTEMALSNKHKNRILEIAQHSLDAAVEEDLPAITHSLLAMLTSSSADGIVTKLKHQFGQVSSGTLVLILDVMGRFMTQGSVVLKCFLQRLRREDSLACFDLLLLLSLMARPVESQIAISVITQAVKKGRVTDHVMTKLSRLLVEPEWKALLSVFVRFCNLLVVLQLKVSMRQSVADATLGLALRTLSFLIYSKSAAQQDALSSLLSVTSHPEKLLLHMNDRVHSISSSETICWKVAQHAATQLAKVALQHTSALAPYAHLFLDHLHSIAYNPNKKFMTSNSSSTTSVQQPTLGSYSHHVLNQLCAAMAALTNAERGVYSLVMITIQKQLVAKSEEPSWLVSGVGVRSSNTKQLMAIQLAFHLLMEKVMEPHDRKRLLHWILKVLPVASEDTNARVLALLTEGVAAGFIPQEELSSLWQNHVSALLANKCLLPLTSKFRGSSNELRGFQHQSSDPTRCWSIDVHEIIAKCQFGLCPTWWLRGEQSLVKNLSKQTLVWYQAKLRLTREAFRVTQACASSEQQRQYLDAGYRLSDEYDPSLLDQALRNLQQEEFHMELDLTALLRTAWNLVVAIHLAAECLNQVVTVHPHHVMTKVQRHARLWFRLEIFMKLFDQLHVTMQLLDAKINSLKPLERPGHDRMETMLLAWQQAQLPLLKTLTILHATSCFEITVSDAVQLDLEVVCAVFDAQWRDASSNPLSATHEVKLWMLLASFLRGQTTQSHGNSWSSIFKLLVSKEKGKKTVMVLARRCAQLAAQLAAWRPHESIDKSSASSSWSETLELAKILFDTLYLLLAYCDSPHVVADGGEEPAEKQMANGDPSSCRMALVEAISQGFLLFKTVNSRTQDQNRLQCASLQYEVLFRFLLHQLAQIPERKLACRVLNCLVGLCLRTQRRQEMAQVALACLHQVFPLEDSCTNTSQEASTTSELLQLVSDLIGDGSAAFGTCLLKYRAQLSGSFIHHTIVISWALSPSTTDRCDVLIKLLNAMASLVKDCASQNNPDDPVDWRRPQRQPKRSRGTRKREQEERVRELDENSEESEYEYGASSSSSSSSSPESESEDDDNSEQDEPVVEFRVSSGEHRFLRSLCLDTFGQFFESIWLCALVTCAQTQIGIDMTQNQAQSPYSELLSGLQLVTHCLQLFSEAQRSGFAFAQRTNMLVLRQSGSLLQSLGSKLESCVEWRREQQMRVDESEQQEPDGEPPQEEVDLGALALLQELFDQAWRVLQTLEHVCEWFEQRNRFKSHHKQPFDVLMEKMRKRKLPKHRPLARQEAKELRCLLHSLESTRDLLMQQSHINNLEVVDNVEEAAQVIDREDVFIERVSIPTPPVDFNALAALSRSQLLTAWKSVRVDIHQPDQPQQPQPEQQQEVHVHEETTALQRHQNASSLFHATSASTKALRQKFRRQMESFAPQNEPHDTNKRLHSHVDSIVVSKTKSKRSKTQRVN